MPTKKITKSLIIKDKELTYSSYKATASELDRIGAELDRDPGMVFELSIKNYNDEPLTQEQINNIMKYFFSFITIIKPQTQDNSSTNPHNNIVNLVFYRLTFELKYKIISLNEGETLYNIMNNIPVEAIEKPGTTTAPDSLTEPSTLVTAAVPAMATAESNLPDAVASAGRKRKRILLTEGGSSTAIATGAFTEPSTLVEATALAMATAAGEGAASAATPAMVTGKSSLPDAVLLAQLASLYKVRAGRKRNRGVFSEGESSSAAGGSAASAAPRKIVRIGFIDNEFKIYDLENFLSVKKGEEVTIIIEDESKDITPDRSRLIQDDEFVTGFNERVVTSIPEPSESSGLSTIEVSYTAGPEFHRKLLTTLINQKTKLQSMPSVEVSQRSRTSDRQIEINLEYNEGRLSLINLPKMERACEIVVYINFDDKVTKDVKDKIIYKLSKIDKYNKIRNCSASGNVFELSTNPRVNYSTFTIDQILLEITNQLNKRNGANIGYRKRVSGIKKPARVAKPTAIIARAEFEPTTKAIIARAEFEPATNAFASTWNGKKRKPIASKASAVSVTPIDEETRAAYQVSSIASTWRSRKRKPIASRTSAVFVTPIDEEASATDQASSIAVSAMGAVGSSWTNRVRPSNDVAATATAAGAFDSATDQASSIAASAVNAIGSFLWTDRVRASNDVAATATAAGALDEAAASTVGNTGEVIAQSNVSSVAPTSPRSSNISLNGDRGR